MGGAAPPPPTVAPAAVAPVAPAAPSAPVAEATVQQLPPRLQDIARPVVISGTVTGRTPDGLTQVRTSAGEILLKSATPIPTDRPVTLQITPPPLPAGQSPGQPQGSTQAGQLPMPRALVFLLQVTPIAAAQTGAATAQEGAGAAPAVILPQPAQPAATALPPLLPGAIVPALVIAAAPRPAALAGPAPQAGQAASQTPSQAVPTLGSPATGAPSHPTTTPPTPPLPMPAGAPATYGTPVALGGDAAHPGTATAAGSFRTGDAAAEHPDLPQGGTVALKILTITPPPAQPGRPAPSPPNGDPAAPGPRMQAGQPDALPEPADTPDGLVLRGTVAGTTPQGQPVLATARGMLALNVQASLPQGARVTAALSDPARALPVPASFSGPPGAVTERSWPAMQQLLTGLGGVDRAAAQTLLATILPQPNRKLTTALTFLMSAMRGGDARGWLGEDTATALEKGGRGELLSQLERDFRTLQQQSNERLPGDWTPYLLPMMDSSGLKPIQLHVHPIQEEDGGRRGGREPKGSRFLLDVELSRLGPMQLDGLVRPNHFDLILRSHGALAPELRLELIQIFADSLRALGYTGGLSFQSGAKCWVKLTRAGKAGLGVTA